MLIPMFEVLALSWYPAHLFKISSDFGTSGSYPKVLTLQERIYRILENPGVSLDTAKIHKVHTVEYPVEQLLCQACR